MKTISKSELEFFRMPPHCTNLGFYKKMFGNDEKAELCKDCPYLERSLTNYCRIAKETRELCHDLYASD